MSWRYLTAEPSLSWPALPDERSAAVLALLYQMLKCERWEAKLLAERQGEQLHALLRHAYGSVPFYRERWRRLPGAADLPQLPILSRRDLQTDFDSLKSAALPPEHGSAVEARTSGSTGTPVRVLKTAVQDLFWRALTLRDHRWHGRDLSATLAVIRKGAGRGSRPSWGPATQGLVETGPCLTLDVDTDTQAQLEWLQRHEPEYLLTYPSLVAELAALSLRRGVKLPRLRQVRTFGEALDPQTHALCREAWNVRLVDFYSSEEVGYLALQCPEHEHYHVQSENVIVEVVDESGSPCAPGESGRVLVTDLHNFATPLIRYEIGDYAEPGEPCSCGRGLPVLRRIVGRTRNMLMTASGRRYWPSLGVRSFEEIAPVLQHQFIQKAFDLIEVRLVTRSPLTADQEARLQALIASKLPGDFRLAFVRCEAIGRGPGGKYEDFVCEVER